MGDHGRMIDRLLNKMRIPFQLRDDARQEAHLGILRFADSFDEGRGATFETFAWMVAHRAVVDWIRRECGRGTDHPIVINAESVHLHANVADPADGLMLGQLRSAIKALRPREREVASMMMDGKTLREIGRAVGVSIPRAGQLRQVAVNAIRLRMGVAA